MRGIINIRKLIVLAALVLVLSFSLITATPAVASPVSWGDTLTTDTTLESDLTGSGTALIIGADGITLDLNGYTLSGDSTGYGIDNTGGYDSVTIKNGTIDGFAQGIRAEGASVLTLNDLSFSGDTGGGHAHVIDIRNSEDVVIKDVTIVVGAGSPWWAEAIRLESVDGVQVTDVEVDGGWIGVNFARESESVAGPPTNGVVKDSTFTGNSLFGVFIANSTDATIEGNEITDAGLFGIYAGSYSGVTGITVKENKVSNTGIYHGIVLNMVNYSSVLENEVSGSGMDGIAVYGAASSNEVKENEVLDSGRYGISLRGGASDNLIKENEVSGSGDYDCRDTTSGGGTAGTANTWTDNEGETSLPSGLCGDDDEENDD